MVGVPFGCFFLCGFSVSNGNRMYAEDNSKKQSGFFLKRLNFFPKSHVSELFHLMKVVAKNL